MRAYLKALSQSHLLTLCAGGAGYYSLAEALSEVLRSKPRSVWVDCQHISALPIDAVVLLRRCASRLWRRGGHLILWHLPEEARMALTADSSQPLAASLLDAAQYGLSYPDEAEPQA